MRFAGFVRLDRNHSNSGTLNCFFYFMIFWAVLMKEVFGDFYSESEK